MPPFGERTSRYQQFRVLGIEASRRSRLSSPCGAIEVNRLPCPAMNPSDRWHDDDRGSALPCAKAEFVILVVQEVPPVPTSESAHEVGARGDGSAHQPRDVHRAVVADFGNVLAE